MNRISRAIWFFKEWIKYPIRYYPEYLQNEIPQNEDITSPFYGWDIATLDDHCPNWKDVFKYKIYNNYKGRIVPCPHCLAELKEELHVDTLTPKQIKSLRKNYVTIIYRDPIEAWNALAGGEGYLTISMKHREKIDFFGLVIS